MGGSTVSKEEQQEQQEQQEHSENNKDCTTDSATTTSTKQGDHHHQQQNSTRQNCLTPVIHSSQFENVVMFLIVLNTGLLAYEAFLGSTVVLWVVWVELCFTVLFIIGTLNFYFLFSL